MKIKKLNEDVRGEMYQILNNGKEFILFDIKAGMARGGDYHTTNQYDLVMDGEVEYRRTLPNGEEIINILRKTDYIMSPKNEPHIFIALEDSLVLEWTELGKFQKELYAPYRKIIDERMKK